MKLHFLDGRKMIDRNKTHEYLKEELNFPSYYGENLDALYDLLTEVKDDEVIIINYSEMIVMNLGDYGNDLIKTFLEASEENGNLEIVLNK